MAERTEETKLRTYIVVNGIYMSAPSEPPFWWKLKTGELNSIYIRMCSSLLVKNSCKWGIPWLSLQQSTVVPRYGSSIIFCVTSLFLMNWLKIVCVYDCLPGSTDIPWGVVSYSSSYPQSLAPSRGSVHICCIDFIDSPHPHAHHQIIKCI